VSPPDRIVLNVFVLVVQMFLKIPALTSLARPDRAAFLVAQLLVLLLFIDCASLRHQVDKQEQNE